MKTKNKVVWKRGNYASEKGYVNNIHVFTIKSALTKRGWKTGVLCFTYKTIELESEEEVKEWLYKELDNLVNTLVS